MVANNTRTLVGAFLSYPGSPTNYSVGMKFGDQLMLPVAGSRFLNIGSLFGRGYQGNYWSSTEDDGDSDRAWSLGFLDIGVTIIVTQNSSFGRASGLPVRCIAE